RDVPAEEHLEARGEVAHHAARADDDPPHHAQRLGHADSGDLEGGGDELVVHRFGSHDVPVRGVDSEALDGRGPRVSKGFAGRAGVLSSTPRPRWPAWPSRRGPAVLEGSGWLIRAPGPAGGEASMNASPGGGSGGGSDPGHPWDGFLVGPENALAH